MEFRSQMAPLFLRTASAAGADLSDVVRDFELPADAMERPELRLSLDRAQALPEEIAQASGDPSLGLHVAASVPRGSYGLYEFALRHAPTLGELLQRALRLNDLLDELTVASVETRGRETLFSLRIPGEPRCFERQGNELVLGYMARLMYEALPGGWSFRRVWFANAAPADVSGLASHFGTADLEFGCASIGVAFDSSDLTRPIAGADPALLGVLDAEAARTLASRPRLDTLRARATVQIRDALASGAPRIDRIAAALGLSARTLQRRLEADGIGFGDLVEHVRHDLALIYLRNEDLAIGEIADRLGYQKPGTFTDAFRRWTGVTPARFRAGR